MKTIRIIARHRLGLILELIGLVSVAIIVWKPVALARGDPKRIPTGSLHMSQAGYTATQLQNGKVLVAGGSDDGNLASTLASDIPVPGDYDGDGKVDQAVYRDGVWFILRSSDGVQTAVGWGLPQDKPVPGDYDGDGKADLAVYRDGVWFILRSSDGGQTTVGWGGVLADVPVPADYDGDGKADVAVYRDGTWFIIRSSDGAQVSAGWGGAAQDIPVPGDYDGERQTWQSIATVFGLSCVLQTAYRLR